jgi:hypothetical protein
MKSFSTNIFCIFAVVFGVAIVAILLVRDCGRTQDVKRQSISHVILVSQNEKVSDCLRLAEMEAAKGNGKVTLRLGDYENLIIEFPLVDNYQIHWQFNPLRDVFDKGLNRPGSHMISGDMVFWIKSYRGKWICGDPVLLGEQDLLRRLHELNKLRKRVVVVCEVPEEQTLATIASIWKTAQDLNFKFYPMISQRNAPTNGIDRDNP